ncbi:MAG: replication-relaxation family protein [Terriglobales bacterium]
MTKFSPRDLRVITTCALGKWLSTSQLQKLCFADLTPDAVRKSLRRLAEAGCLVSMRQDRMSEAFHGLGRKGKELLASRGLDREVVRKLPEQLEHLAGINDLRIAVESEPERVAYFFAAWELAGISWPYPVLPDAVCRLKLPVPTTFAFEYDRGTEPLAVLRRKLRMFAGIRNIRIAAVVVIVATPSRIYSLAGGVGGHGDHAVLATELTQIRENGVYGPIFHEVWPNRAAGSRSLADVGDGGGL